MKSETSVRLRFYQNEQFCVFSYPKMTIYVSLIGQSYCSYISNWWKMKNQDLAVLHVDSDTAELRYLICMAQSFELSFVKSFCNVFSLNSASLRYLIFYFILKSTSGWNLFHVEISIWLLFQIELSDWRNGLFIMSFNFRCQVFADKQHKRL